MKKMKISVLFLLMIAVSAFSCDFFDDNTDCSENAEDGYMANLGGALAPRAALHPGSSRIYENCDPTWQCNCPENKDRAACSGEAIITRIEEVCVDGVCTNQTTEYENVWRQCTYTPSECECINITFRENCTRSPEIYDNGRLCGRYGLFDPPSDVGCGTTGHHCIYEDGYMREGYVAHNGFLQCFVGKYLFQTGGNPNDITPYFPLPYPEIEIYSRICTGVPEGGIYTYNTGGLTIRVEGQAHADCGSCRRDIEINGVFYSYRQDPDCGRDIEGSAFGASFCSSQNSTG